MSTIVESPEVFVGSFEVKPGPGSEMSRKSTGIGGFVYCFCESDCEENAVQQMRKALEADKYVIVDQEYVAFLPELEFDSEDEKAYFFKFAVLSIESQDLVYSDFYTYRRGDD